MNKVIPGGQFESHKKHEIRSSIPHAVHSKDDPW